MDKVCLIIMGLMVVTIIGLITFEVIHDNTEEGRLEALARRSIGNKLVKEYKGQELTPTVSGSPPVMTVIPTDKWDEYVIMNDGSIYR